MEQLSHPGIPDVNCIDLIGIRRDGRLDLGIVVSQPLDGSEHSQRVLLAKIEYYLRCGCCGAFRDDSGNRAADPLQIIITFVDQPDPEIVELIRRCQDYAAARNARIAYEVESGGDRQASAATPLGDRLPIVSATNDREPEVDARTFLTNFREECGRGVMDMSLMMDILLREATRCDPAEIVKYSHADVVKEILDLARAIVDGTDQEDVASWVDVDSQELQAGIERFVEYSRSTRRR